MASMTSETVAYSGSNELYAALPVEISQRLEDHQESRVFAQGEKLIRKNIPLSHLLIIKSGSVEISVLTRGTAIPIASVGAGKVLGMRALVSGEPPEIEATCLEDCAATLISKNTFIQLLKEYPQIYLAVAKVLSADLQAAHRQLRRDRAR